MDEKQEMASLKAALDTPLAQTIESVWPQFRSSIANIRINNEKILMLVLWCLDSLKNEDGKYHFQNMWFDVNNYLKDLAFESRNYAGNNGDCDKVTNIVFAFAIDCLEWSTTIELASYYNSYYLPVRNNLTITNHFGEIKEYVQTIKKDIIKWHRGSEIKKWLADYLENDVFYTTEEFEWEDWETIHNSLESRESIVSQPSQDDPLNRIADSIDRLSINSAITSKHPQMPPYLMHERAVEMYNFLIKGNYIDEATSPEHFLYLMGVTGIAPEKIKLINWLKSQQQLRTFLTLAFDYPITRKSLKIADIEKRTPLCFLHKGKTMVTLANATKELSQDLDAIRDFFRPK